MQIPTRNPRFSQTVSSSDDGETVFRCFPSSRAARLIGNLLSICLFAGGAPAEADETMAELNLSGEWAFRMDEMDAGIKEQWFSQKLPGTIQLPGSMQEQRKGKPVGYDTQFAADIWKKYPAGETWKDDENYKPFLKEGEFRFPFWLISDFHYIGPAWYQKEVEVPENWSGADIELFLERCLWETQVWVDEEAVGMNNALGVPHRYQLGKALKPGKNTLTIRVDNRIKEINVGGSAHSISDNTQSCWNGIVGELKLVRSPSVSVGNVGIFPDVPGKSVKLEITLLNVTGEAQAGKMEVSARVAHPNDGPQVKPLRTEFNAGADGDKVTLVYPLGDEILLWDEFAPNLYELTVQLKSDKGQDTWTGTFGMRDIRSTEKGLWINDRPLFLRGTLECAIFPKTGYPPTTPEPWERIIRIAKDHGLNHIRFHSWCPPKVAFEVADRMGFYYQVEASTWAADIGSGKPIDKWVYEESERMIAEYGNHPSFSLMAHGNEPHGPNHLPFLTEFVKYWKAKDTRRIHTMAAGWAAIPENDFHNIYHYVRIQGWNSNLNSVINRESPRSNYDWSNALKELKSPVVSHEIGQWCVYPNFRELPKYDGVLKATNFEIFRDSLKSRGLLHLADDYVKASGKLQALCYKADIEAALRTVGFGGFQLLDLRDFPGQGTALVGLLDPFWDEKGYISPEEFRQFSNQTVPLARIPKHILTHDEKLECVIEVAHYGPKELESVTPTWKVVTTDGKTVREGKLETTKLSWGNGQKLGTLSEAFDVAEATQLQLQVEVAGFMNSWDFWVYPKQLPEAGKDVLVVRTLDDAAEKKLHEGGKVLLTIEKGTIRDGAGGEVGVGFSSIFWNTAWTNGQLPHTLGILCDPKHPALAHFPTEFHSNWQWWDAMSHSNAISLQAFKNTPQPIVRIIDDWVTNRSLGMLFEMKVGKGSLVVSGVDLISNADRRPEARQLLFSVKRYMASDAFAPKTEATVEEVRALFKTKAEWIKSRATAKADHSEKGFEAQDLLDGNPSTLWHTPWQQDIKPYPHTVTMDLGEVAELTGITCLPRQDGNWNGLIAAYEVYLSQAPENKGTLMAKGEFSGSLEKETIQFEKAHSGRYLTFVATKGFGDSPLASLAEIDFLLQEVSEPETP